MPELVDVEIVMRRLRRWMHGATIAGVAVHARDRRLFRPGSPAAFRRALAGRTVRAVSRRGKWIRVDLDGGVRLFSHLGMTGDWVARRIGDAAERSERARLDLQRSRGRSASLRYTDPRKFGRLVVAHGDIAEWRALGRDPLADGLEARSLAASLGRSRRALKVALMDQRVLPGIGNILATEALWAARLDPRMRSDRLTHRDVAALVRALGATIRREVAHRGEGAERLRVYGRAGEPCRRCGTKLSKLVLGGRTTALCPRCQRR